MNSPRNFLIQSMLRTAHDLGLCISPSQDLIYPIDKLKLFLLDTRRSPVGSTFASLWKVDVGTKDH